MYKYLLDFIDANNILCKYKFSFRKNHFTNHAVITLVNKISTALDSGISVVGCYIDLKKAFDTVDHKILMKKFELYGIRGPILNCFKSYLNNRKQFVYINEVKSGEQNIKCGVPQGSILGPLLFILNINDLENISKSLFPILFADDATILIEAKNVISAIHIMNQELDKLTIWLKANKLTLNISKTHYMIFHRTRIKHDNYSPLYFDNHKSILSNFQNF